MLIRLAFQRNNFSKKACTQAGGISVSGKALILQATHKCVFELACQPRMGLLATRKRVARIVYAYLITFSIYL